MPTVTLEQDDLRREVRQSTAATLHWYPKAAGVNATASAATFTVYDPAGTEVQASTSATITDIGGEYSRLDMSVPSIATLDENYRIDLLWTDNATSITHLEVVGFDVVRYPFGRPSTSYNDLVALRGDAGEVLSRIAALIGSTATVLAGQYAVDGRLKIEAKVRDWVDEYQRQATHESTGEDNYRRFGRPHLIINRERLNRPERLYALAAMYAADMGNPEGEDESARLRAFYDKEADEAFAGAGALSYDRDQDGVVDDVVTNIGRLKYSRRVQ